MRQKDVYYSTSLSKTSFRRPLVASLFVLVLSTTAYCQCDWGANTYSDIWIWGQNQATVVNGEMSYDTSLPAGSFHVAAAGAIDAPYNSCGHEYSVVSTTLYGPTGQFAEGYGGADLPFVDPDGRGDYYTTSAYEQFCPIANNSYSAGTSDLSVPGGVSITCFNFVRVLVLAIDNKGVYNIGLYNIMSPCNVNCKANTLTYKTYYPTILPTAISSVEPWVGIPPLTVCSHAAFLKALPEGAICTACVDYDFPL